MKKYVKIALLVIVALIFLGTFVFLYQKSQPKETVYNTEKAEIYSSCASKIIFCKAPSVILTGIPSRRRPTSVSSMFPRKIKSFMLATVAIVVPSLKVLLMITEFPAFTGTSRINPSMVERMSVLLNEALFLVMPSLMISRLSLAV